MWRRNLHGDLLYTNTEHKLTAHVNIKTKIPLQRPSMLVFYSFLIKTLVCRERGEMGGPDGDAMFACGLRNSHTNKINIQIA